MSDTTNQIKKLFAENPLNEVVAAAQAAVERGEGYDETEREAQWRATTLEHLNRAYDNLQAGIATRSETARKAAYSKHKLDTAEAAKTLELRDVKPEAVRTAQIRLELAEQFEETMQDKLAAMYAQSEFEIAEAEVDRVNAIYSIG